MKKPIPFGKYYLMDRVAVGGMAEVFKAKTFGVDGFEKIVALKRILPNIAEDEEFITMFIDEAKIAVKLSHANIVQIFQLGHEEGNYFIAMEYIHGRDLRTLFDRSRRKGAEKLDPKMIAYAIARVCEGLDYAHRKKDDNGDPLHIVHRDVSPQNILISYEGDVKIIDFGVAKAQNKMNQTQAGILKGKFAYMSPEQIQGLPLDQRSDVFALGIVLYELLTGQRLFVGESDFHTLEMIRNMAIVPPSHKNPDVPHGLDMITMKALHRDLNQRYQWASEMHEDIQRFLYSNPPIYTRQDLAQGLRHMFLADIEKDKQRSAAYEPFFQELARNPAVAQAQLLQTSSPVYSPGVAPVAEDPQGYHFSYSGSYPNNPAQAVSQSGMYPQFQQPPAGGFAGYPAGYSAGHPQQAAVAVGVGPSYASPPPPPPSAFSGTGSYPMQGGVGLQATEDIGDSTMFDPSGRMMASPLAQMGQAPPPPSPYMPNPGFAASPYAAPGLFQEQSQPGAYPPSMPLMEEDDEGGGGDTMIDLSMTENDLPKGNKKKWLLWGSVATATMALVVVVLLLVFRGNSNKSPDGEGNENKEAGKLFVVFRKPAQDVSFFLGNQPFPKKRIKQLSPTRFELLFYEKTQQLLVIRRDGYRNLSQPVRIEPGDEMQTPFLDMKPNLGKLVLETDPPGATIFLDGQLQAQQTPANLMTTIGPHVLQVMKQGRKPWEQRITLEEGKDASLKLSLEKTNAVLTVVCRAGEGSGKIYLDRRYKGTTPKEIRLNPMRSYNLEVKPSKYKKTYKEVVTFPLSPTKRIAVDCVAPAANAKGTIKLISIPQAKVWIDDKYVGTTPQEVTLSPGSHTFRFVSVKKKKLHVTTLDITSGQNAPFVLNQWKN